MFAELTPEIISGPEFKEDAVREIILAPILAKLGFGPAGDTRVVRSKALQNPFIRMGTRNHPVTTIPDYTVYVDDRIKLVIDAKAPHEEILSYANIQQAYSYAIHPEIRCDYFALCNGLEIAVFDTSDPEPLLHLQFVEFETKWEQIEQFISPRYLREPRLRKFSPDLGLALVRMGFHPEMEIVFVGARLNFFAKIDEQTLTASSNCDMGFGKHMVNFDFDRNLLEPILAGLPEQLRVMFIEALNKYPFMASAGLHVEADITARLGEEVEGASETFVPLIITQVGESRFNPIDVPPAEENDAPGNVFKLRDAFKIIAV